MPRGIRHRISKKKNVSNVVVRKNVNEFYNNKNNPTGTYPYCKQCVNNESRKKRLEKKRQEYMKSIGYEEPDRSIPIDIDLEEIKTCTACKVDKPLKEYRYNYYKQNKKGYFRNDCKSCEDKRKKENYHKREIEKLREMRGRN